MALPSASLTSTSQLLAQISKQTGSTEAEPRLEDLLDSVQAGGTAPPAAADQLEVFPEPGFVVKTANELGQKIFINVCGSGKVPLPGGWSRGQVPAEVRDYLERQQGGEAPATMRFPLSMGPPRLEKDHKGQPCLVLDCILHSELLTQCAEYRPLKLFLIQLAMATAAQKNSLDLDPKYKLPKMRYKGGTPPPQFIRVEGSKAGGGGGSGAAGSGQRPMIAEVDAEGKEVPAFALLANKRQQRQQQQRRQPPPQQLQDAAAKHPEQAQQQQQPAPPAAANSPAGSTEAAVARPQADAQQQPAQQQQVQKLHPRIEYSGKPASAVSITLPLPAAVAAGVQQDPGSVQATVCAEAVRVQVPGCEPVEVQLPFAVDAAGGKAQLAPAAANSAAGSLVLTLPYRPFGSVLEELRQAAMAADGVRSCTAEGGSLSELD